jgi:hypothetical protein
MPWSILVLFSGLFFLRTLKINTKGIVFFEQLFPWSVLALLFWSSGALLVVYGSGLYQDHLQPGAIGLGNSFLRYLIPLYFLMVPLMAFVFSSLCGRMKTFFVILSFVLMGYGVWFSFFQTDEALLPLSQEIVRYDFIRESSQRFFTSQDIIISPRSDKIFFPVMRVVSPVPNLAHLRSLFSECHCSLGWFDRPVDEALAEKMRNAGFRFELLAEYGNEVLYRLMPL